MDVSWLRETIPVNSAPTAIVLAVVLVIFLRGYFNYNSTYSYFSKRGIKGPTPLPYFGNMLDFFLRVVVKRDKQLYDTYGPIHGTYEMALPVLTLGDPEVMKTIMVRDFAFFVDRRTRSNDPIAKHFLNNMKGDEWKRARNAITPTFTSGKIKQMMALMKECVNDLKTSLERKVIAKDYVDIKRVFGFFTTDVIARCAFATQTNVQQEGLQNPFMKQAEKFVSPSRLLIASMLILPRFLDRLVMLASSDDSLEYLADVVKNILEQRKKNPLDYTRSYKDLLQLMMEASGEEATGENSVDDDVPNLESHHVQEDNTKQGVKKLSASLSQNEVIANAITSLAAGYETTSTLLTHAAYSLAMNPEKQEKLRKEIKDAYEAAGNKINYEDLSTLKYLDAVICETLRLYPPAIRFDRQCTQDYILDVKIEGQQRKLSLKRGDVVRFPAYAVHHDPKYYPNPEQWEPERFMPENKHLLTPYTYIPFGAGPRNCIGMRFALLEAKLALAECLLSFKFVTCDKTPNTLSYMRGDILLRSDGMIIKVEKV